jgi:hypothetical protein
MGANIILLNKRFDRSLPFVELQLALRLRRLQIINLNFVTHCDSQYLSRAVILRESIQEKSDRCNFILVCHDEITFKAASLLGIPESNMILLDQIIERYKELKNARDNRTHIEFLYCLTPFIMRYVLDILDLNEIVYIDADKFILGNPENLFIDASYVSIAISSHNFPPKLKYLNKFGKYNVGVIFARKSQDSLEVLNWWSKKCIESTSISKQDIDVFGDQKYLDEFQVIYPNTHIYNDKGINSAPWNCTCVYIKQGLLYRDHGDLQLVTFHFSGLRYNKHFYIAGYNRYGIRLQKSVKKYLYKDYVKRLIEADSKIDSLKYKRFSLREIVRGFLFLDIGLILIQRKRSN